MPSPIVDLAQVLTVKAPPALDNAISTLNPMWSQERTMGGVTGNPSRLPVIRRRDPSCGLGPQRKVRVVGNPSGGSYAPGGGGAVPGATEIVTQQQGWGKYRASFAATQFDLDQLAAGVLQVESYFMQQLDGMAEAISGSLAADVFNGIGGDNLDGLNNLGINGAVYGGITRALYPNHAPFIDTAGGLRNISVPVLDNAWDTFRTTVDPLPGTWFGVTSVAQITAMRALAVGAGVFENVATNSIKTLGNDAVEYNGIPIFGMVNFPANIIDFYRAESLAWECLRGAASPIYIDPEPEKTDDTFKWNAYLHVQVCLDNPRRSAFSINQLT
jgi:hypothetical protein